MLAREAIGRRTVPLANLQETECFAENVNLFAPSYQQSVT